MNPLLEENNDWRMITSVLTDVLDARFGVTVLPSFSPSQVRPVIENMSAVMEAVVKARPAASKGTYIRKVTLCNTMGPAIRVDVAAATTLSTA